MESDDTSLTDKDINDFIKVVRFFEKLIKNKENNSTFFIFVKTIIDGILNDNKIGGSLNNYIEKYEKIEIKSRSDLEAMMKIQELLDKNEDYNSDEDSLNGWDYFALDNVEERKKDKDY